MCGGNKMLTTGRDGKNKERFSEGTRSFGVKTIEREEQNKFEMEQEKELVVSPSPYVKSKTRLKVTHTGRAIGKEVGKIEKTKTKVTTKNIAMMVAFSVVAVALSIVIAVNAISLGTLTEKNAKLQGEITAFQAEYALLNNELLSVSNANIISGLAENTLDMTASAASQTVGYVVPGYKAVEEVVYQTNWFDELLDSMS